MKFRVRDRIALAIYALIGILGTLAFGYQIYTANSYINGVQAAIMVVIMLALLVYSVLMIRLAFRNVGKEKSSVTVQNTEQGNGEVRVSIQALDSLVKQAIAGKSDGIADIKTSIVNHDDSISVQIEMSLNGDVHIPNISMLLQSSVKGFIEEYSGILVRDVSIMVKTIVPVMPQLAIEENGSKEQVALSAGTHGETAVPETEEQVAAEEPSAQNEDDEEAVVQERLEEEEEPAEQDELEQTLFMEEDEEDTQEET